MLWGPTSGLHPQDFRDMREDVVWERTSELTPEADEEGESRCWQWSEPSVQTQDRCDRRPAGVCMSLSFKAKA